MPKKVIDLDLVPRDTEITLRVHTRGTQSKVVQMGSIYRRERQFRHGEVDYVVTIRLDHLLVERGQNAIANQNHTSEGINGAVAVRMVNFVPDTQDWGEFGRGPGKETPQPGG